MIILLEEVVGSQDLADLVANSSRSSVDPLTPGADKSGADHDVPEGVTDEPLDPSPLWSCPTPPASRATYIARNQGHSTSRDPAPRAPDKFYQEIFIL